MHLIFVGQGYPQKLFNLEHFPIYSILIPQMYNVYKDPEGKRVLEEPSSHHQTATILKTTISTENEEGYKKRIESLNEEMKVLNDELAMVWL